MSTQSSMRTERYGILAGQEGDLHLPRIAFPRVVCLLHGGFWRMPYGRDQMTGIARDLADRGLAVWNLEYRRLGVPGVAWPGIGEDVLAGVTHLAQLVAQGVALDLEKVTIAGHSAGGQLALWTAAQCQRMSTPVGTPRIRVGAAVGMAPVADLEMAHALNLGGGAVRELLGGSPMEQLERCLAASPRAMLPIGVSQLLIHGTEDPAVPVEMSRRYAHAARSAGDPCDLVELNGAGHMEFLDPDSAAHAVLCDWLGARLQ